ncbi:NAD(P)H-dependent oxidoreductase subunit E [Pelotomaculum propionicicum]|uniref:NADH-quinone oxidoreductase subunit NuoE family protein n=1 Tax=Pelotomaculum propionicicum TaxID=258475 RepID=UPI003B7FD875
MAQEIHREEELREREIPAAFVYDVMPGEEKEEKIKENKYDELNRVISLYSKEPGQLIRILQKAQDIFGHLPEEVQAYIAEKTETPVSEVNGVVTFYSLFSAEPRGKYTLDLCMGTACYIKGAQELMDTLKDHLKIDSGETTPDQLFTVKSTRCIGACGLAPILVVNGDVHGNATTGEILKIIKKYRKGEEIESKKH